MDVRVKFGPAGASEGLRQDIVTGLPKGTLASLFRALSQRHPDLAPLLEDPQETKELEILVNNRPLASQMHEGFCLRDGDTVSLLVKHQ